MIEYFWFWLSAMFGLLALYYFSNAMRYRYSGRNSINDLLAYQQGFLLGALERNNRDDHATNTPLPVS